jgi:prepilin-type N-terminal cleavage/methylation domain-containing protein
MMLNRSKSKKGFTLIELMIVIFIISILSAVAIPYMRNRTEAAKWSEGKAIAGSIRTTARSFCSDKGPMFDYASINGPGAIQAIGFEDGDLDGKYFTDDCFSIQFSPTGDYLITVDATQSKSGDSPSTPRQMTFNSAGVFTEIP